MSIKISDLVAGETVLVDKNGDERLVLDVFTNTIHLSDTETLKGCASPYSEWELNEYFTILEPKKPKIPEVGNYFETMPFVRVRHSDGDIWNLARLLSVRVLDTSDCQTKEFKCITGDTFVRRFEKCELIEENE